MKHIYTILMLVLIVAELLIAMINDEAYSVDYLYA